MFDGLPNYTWDECLRIFSGFSEREPSEELKPVNPTFKVLSQTMVSLVELLRDDSEIPELNRLISHITLRLWYPDMRWAEVHISPVDKDILVIGLNQFEDVKVPLELAAKAVKHFLKKIKSRQSVFLLEKDETGLIEREMSALPLDWVQAAALEKIFAISLRHGYYTVNGEQKSDIPTDVLNKIALNMAEITKLVMKTWEIAREKRTQEWLKELEKDND